MPTFCTHRYRDSDQSGKVSYVSHVIPVFHPLLDATVNKPETQETIFLRTSKQLLLYSITFIFFFNRALYKIAYSDFFPETKSIFLPPFPFPRGTPAVFFLTKNFSLVFSRFLAFTQLFIFLFHHFLSHLQLPRFQDSCSLRGAFPVSAFQSLRQFFGHVKCQFFVLSPLSSTTMPPICPG